MSLDVVMGIDPDCLVQASGQPEQAAAPTFFDIISGDEDTTMRSIVQITNGVTGIVDKVQTLLVYWEKKYKHMWDQDKDAYIRYGYMHGLAGPTLMGVCLIATSNVYLSTNSLARQARLTAVSLSAAVHCSC